MTGKQHGFIPLLILIGAVTLGLTAGGVYFFTQPTNPDLTPTPTPYLTNPTPISSKGDSDLPTETSQPISTPNLSSKTTAISPDKFGFTKLIEIKGAGVKAKFPIGTQVNLLDSSWFSAKVGNSDTVNFFIRNYDGGGRRAWFQKEFKPISDTTYTAFTGPNHSGYIASGKSTYFYYFSATSSNKMLVIQGVNDPNGQGIFFDSDLEKFKSFLSTVELVKLEPVTPSYITGSDLYRWGGNRKTIWENKDLGLKITSTEWTESRLTRERDVNGNYLYSDWTRVYPSTTESSSTSEKVTRTLVNGGFMSLIYLDILLSDYSGKSLDDLAKELLLPAGFCRTEWKNSKSECPDSLYCYTKDEVLNNLVVKKSTKIGGLEAQLRDLNSGFSGKNDCRAVETWLIRAKNGQFVLTNIYPEGEPFRLEAF